MAYVPIPDSPSQSSSGASIGPPPSTRESRAEVQLQSLTNRLRSVFETKPSKPRIEDGGGSPASPPQSEVAATLPQQPTASDQAAQPAPASAPAPAPKPVSHNDVAHDTEIALARQAPPKIDTTPVSSIPPQALQTPSLPKPPPSQPAPAPAVSSQNAPAVAPASAPNPPSAPAVVRAAQSGFEGEWIYAPAKPEKRKPGLYPPDFIELKLFRSQGELHGIYHARYQVDQAQDISPEVSFQLSSQEANAKMLTWESANGSRGWLKVNAVDKSTIKVQWQTTVYSKQPSLTAGVATLIRR